MAYQVPFRLVSTDKQKHNSDMRMEVRPSSHYTGTQFFEDRSLPVRVLHIENSPAYPEHSHDFDELVVISRGSALHGLNGRQYKVRRGDVYCIPKGVGHSYHGPEELDYVNVVLDSDAFGRNPDGLSAGSADSLGGFFDQAGLLTRLSLFGLREVTEITDQIDSELYRRAALHRPMISNLIVRLWLTLQRRSMDREAPDESDTRSRVQRVIEIIESDPGASISIEDMASEAYTGVRNFQRVFRSITGESPWTYLRRLRIERSCEPLVETDRPISRIAALVGFPDSNYFSRCFRATMGCSPLEYRLGNRH